MKHLIIYGSYIGKAYELVHTLGNSKPSSRLDLLSNQERLCALKVEIDKYGMIVDIEAQVEDLICYLIS